MSTRESGGTEEDTRLADVAYRFHGPLLRKIAEHKFRVPPGDAETLVNEVFVAYLRRRTIIGNLEKWLVGAVCHASRDYWRKQRRVEPLPSFAETLIDTRDADPESRIVRQLFVAAGIRQLPSKCRTVITMYYGQGYSAAEIAERLDITAGYATQLLSSCRKRAQVIFSRPMVGRS